jgi:hypothetical protein
LAAYRNSPTVRQEIAMANIQKSSASVQLAYTGSRFSGRIRGYWVDRFARDIRTEIVEINYQEAYIRGDININYKLSPRWTASFDWRNFTNDGDVRKIFDRTGGYYTSGMVINLSVKGDF